LVAYLTLTESNFPSHTALRQFLQEKLPDYMIPSVFVILDEFPRTTTGKVDRRSLPAPDRFRPELDSQYTPARNSTEKLLVAIWAKVLGLDCVGIHDNFIDLGGHSLAATRVISRVINTLKIDLPVKSLFESPTVADMAMVITQNQSKKFGEEKLACMLTELESLSDEEARQHLAEEGK
jgi:non-ribosomal peptide synthetase component E (peptide arylation enzyme)